MAVTRQGWGKGFSVAYIWIYVSAETDGKVFICPESPLSSQSSFIEIQYCRDKYYTVLYKQGNPVSLTG